MSGNTSAGGAPAPGAGAPPAEPPPSAERYDSLGRGCLPWLLGLIVVTGITVALIMRFGEF